MMQTVLYRLIRVALVFPLLIGAGRAAAEAPKLVPAQAEIDFGRVAQGNKAAFEFVLRNEGDAPLQIDEVKPSCGCTAALVTENTVAPGGEARIRGDVKTAGFQDRITKSITVTSNDPTQPKLTLTVTGIVDVPFHLEPRYINFGQVKRGEGSQKVVVLTVQDETQLPLQLGEATVQNEFITVAVAPQAGEEPPRAFDITVSLSEDAPQGVLSTPILIPLAGQDEPLRVSLYANVVGSVALYPQTVSLGLVEEGKEVVRNFVVMSPTQSPFEVTDARCDLPGCTVTLTPIPNQAHRFRLTLRLAGGGLPDGRVEGTLTVATSAEDSPMLTAKLIGSVKHLDAPTPAPAASPAPGE